MFSPFVDAYQGGIETPNPDVACNRHIKFDALRKYVTEKLGISIIATGHYVRTNVQLVELSPQVLRNRAEFDSSFDLINSKSTECCTRSAENCWGCGINMDWSKYRVALWTSFDSIKDQSYFLSMIKVTVIHRGVDHICLLQFLAPAFAKVYFPHRIIDQI